MTWYCPIDRCLIPTTNRDLSVNYGATQLPIYPHPGAFGVRRKHHTHEGVDLYVPILSDVYAVEDGEIVAIVPFTGPNAGSPWWNDTLAILIEGESGVVVYGEIENYPEIKIGMKVKQGYYIGYIKQVLKKDKGYPMSMLHLELHKHGTRDVYDWTNERPESLLDPTEHLLRSIDQ